MNKLGWVFTYSEDFLTAAEVFVSEIETRLCASPPEPETEELLNLKSSFEEFISSANKLLNGDTDPATLRVAVQPNGDPIPNYFVLRVGPWLGYHRLDFARKVGLGVFALREGPDLHNKLARLLSDVAKGSK